MSESTPTTSEAPAKPAPVVTGTVTVGKPWYLSKKVVLALLGLVIALYSAYTGKTESLPEVLATVSKVASILGVIVPTILALAHVDAKERDLASALILEAKTLAVPDAAEPVVVGPAPAAFDAPGLASSRT